MRNPCPWGGLGHGLRPGFDGALRRHRRLCRGCGKVLPVALGQEGSGQMGGRRGQCFPHRPLRQQGLGLNRAPRQIAQPERQLCHGHLRGWARVFRRLRWVSICPRLPCRTGRFAPGLAGCSQHGLEQARKGSVVRAQPACQPGFGPIRQSRWRQKQGKRIGLVRGLGQGRGRGHGETPLPDPSKKDAIICAARAFVRLRPWPPPRPVRPVAQQARPRPASGGDVPAGPERSRPALPQP